MWCLLVANGRGLCDRFHLEHVYQMLLHGEVLHCLAGIWPSALPVCCCRRDRAACKPRQSCSECCVVCCRYVGQKGISIGIDTFGASAPGPLLYEKYGITVENLVATAKKLSP